MESHVCHVDVLVGGRGTGLEGPLCAAPTKASGECSHLWVMAALGAEMTSDGFSFHFLVFCHIIIRDIFIYSSRK